MKHEKIQLETKKKEAYHLFKKFSFKEAIELLKIVIVLCFTSEQTSISTSASISKSDIAEIDNNGIHNLYIVYIQIKYTFGDINMEISYTIDDY